ncbi:hypothetical protein GCM10009837_66110 [Streptomyces durmitorensis]|uniref:hypothetical protein n=1 Tax=Streptomyces sp. NPDC047525 TaxID=3155264 RepID=UPI00338B5A37
MTGRARAHRYFAAALAAGVLAPALLTGCAQSVDPIERLGRKAAEKVPKRKPMDDRCGQAFRTAERVGTAPPAGPPKTGQIPASGKELPDHEKRCPDTGETPPAPRDDASPR